MSAEKGFTLELVEEKIRVAPGVHVEVARVRSMTLPMADIMKAVDATKGESVTLTFPDSLVLYYGSDIVVAPPPSAEVPS